MDLDGVISTLLSPNTTNKARFSISLSYLTLYIFEMGVQWPLIRPERGKQGRHQISKLTWHVEY